MEMISPDFDINVGETMFSDLDYADDGFLFPIDRARISSHWRTSITLLTISDGMYHGKTKVQNLEYGNPVPGVIM